MDKNKIQTAEQAIAKFQELKDYIISQIEKGNFKTLEVDAYTVKIEIDGYFKQSIWIANGIDHISFSTSIGGSTLGITAKNLTVEEQGIIWNGVVNNVGGKRKINEKAIASLKARIKELEEENNII